MQFRGQARPGGDPLRSGGYRSPRTTRTCRCILRGRPTSRWTRRCGRLCPPKLRDIWDSFQPKGADSVGRRALTRVRGRPHTRATGDSAGHAPPTNQLRLRGGDRTSRDCEAVYEGFPLPLRGSQGADHDHSRSRSESIARRRCTRTALLEFSGTVRRSGEDATTVELAIDAKDIGVFRTAPASAPLAAQAVVERRQARRQGGSVSFERLAMTLSPGQRSKWEFTGKAELKGIVARTGVGSSPTSGEPSVPPRARWASQWEIDGRSGLVVVAHRRTSAGQNHGPVLPPHRRSRYLRIQEILGDFCGGKVMAEVDIDTSRSGPAFGLSLALPGRCRSAIS